MEHTLPGLRARPLTDADVPAWAALLRRAEPVDRPRYRWTEEDLAEDLHAEGLDPARHSTGGFDGDGELRAAGLVGLRAGDVQHLRLFLAGVVDPAHRRRGVGSALLRWGADVARERAAQRRAELGPVPAWLWCTVEEHRADLAALCAAHGLRVLRWFATMHRDLRPGAEPPVPAAPAVPDGYRLLALAGAARELGVDPGELDERLRAAHAEAFADHWMSQPLTREDWRTRVTGHREARPDWSRVAVRVGGPQHGEVAGYALAYAHVADWEGLGFPVADLGSLGVRRPHRRAGLARALLGAVALAARADGMAAVSLEVDSENPSGAVGLYESAGYRTVHRHAVQALPV
ncbi:GNAT family N-acetyltransferase [Kineococcus gypseus]|uniref:GNAT family N-acetyltransferase n=1 Tax=Kineococcus gypseus TaxID=1637102 RepID=UPI003D7C832B